MGKLSSDTLFHYVSEIDFLIDVLKNNFRPRYVIEKFDFEDENLKKVGIPMLCFCDIKLSNLDEHASWYGQYGIGMRKEWGIKNGITPVHYYNKESHVIKYLSESVKTIRNIYSFDTSQELIQAYLNNYYNLWYMKTYEGRQLKNGKSKYKKFYDEREWRYIPPMEKLKKSSDGLPISLQGKNIKKYNKHKEYRNRLNNQLGDDTTLHFEPNDISYVIVSKEMERRKIINAIRDAKRKYREEDIELLYSKILTFEQISRDF